jgi:osmotically-inducible protein OsmY
MEREMTSQNGLTLSDEELREAVFGALKLNERTAKIELRVGVLNAIVHLAGAAATKDDWLLIEQVVGAIPGVRGVVNRIDAPGAPSPSRVVHLEIPEPRASTGEK